MYFNSPLIATGIVLIIIIAISWFVGYQRKSRQKNLIKEFDDFAKNNHLLIDKKQTLNKNMIGIDKVNRKLAFLDRSQLPGKFYLLDLNEVQLCDLLKITNPKNGFISNISLRCKYKSNKPDSILPFFKEGTDQQLKTMRLSKKAVYWVKAVNLFKDGRSA